MRRFLLLTLSFAVIRCAAPAPPPAPVPAPAPVEATPVEEKVLGTVHVTASALNVRAQASADAEVIVQLKKGTLLSVLREDESWTRVRLASGETGWVASRFVSSGAETKKTRRGGGKCPPDSDYAFTETPTLAFSDSGAHGLVVVEATVNTKGIVTATKVVSNGTGDETLAFLAQKEIRAAKFSPPIRGCAPRAFIFTYRRTY
jgi:uncharacterized protein YgiM (DUF1202 family)